MTTILFGVGLSTSSAPGADPVSDARRAERLGFDFVSASDHPSGTSPTFETWTMLSWVAAQTTSIRVLSRVLAVPFRAPAMVAKMAESLDRLSGGRLVLGLGAGAGRDEPRAFGLPALPAGVRVAGLADAVRIVRGLWTEPSFTYRGAVHHVEAAPFEPKPSHGIPVWLGTFADRSLAITGELADGWIPSLDYAGAGRLAGMRAKVLDAAAAAGRDPASLTCALNLVIRLAPTADPEPDRVVGPPAFAVERLAGYVAAGFTALNLLPAGPDPAAELEQIAEHVVPAVRDAGAVGAPA